MSVSECGSLLRIQHLGGGDGILRPSWLRYSDQQNQQLLGSKTLPQLYKVEINERRSLYVSVHAHAPLS